MELARDTIIATGTEQLHGVKKGKRLNCSFFTFDLSEVL